MPPTKNGLIQKRSLSTVSGASEQIKEKPRILKLNKAKDGYGFYLKMDRSSPMHVILALDKDSAADKAGLKVGEILACVDGEDVMHASHDDCVNRIRDAGDSVDLTVASKAVMDFFYQHDIAVTSEFIESWQTAHDSPPDDLDAVFEDNPATNERNLHPVSETKNFIGDLLEDMKSQSVMKEQTSTGSSVFSPATVVYNNQDSNPPLPRFCEIRKEEGSFGFDYVYTQTGSHRISYIELGGAAHKAGLREGDRILEVNDVGVFGKTHSDVVEMITAGRSHVVFIVISDGLDPPGETVTSHNETSPPMIPHTDIGRFHETLRLRERVRDCHVTKKEEEEFEFFLAMGARNGQYITKITPRGPADRCGLRNGDRVIEVNGTNVEYMSHEQVVEIIRKGTSRNQVRFLVSNEQCSPRQIEQTKEGCTIS